MSKSLRVKKGNEVLEIQDTDLQAAVNDGYLPTDTVIVANSKTKEVYEIAPQDLPSAFKDGFSFQDVKKKELGGGSLGSKVGGLEPQSTVSNNLQKIGSGVMGKFADVIINPTTGKYPKANINFDIESVSQRSKTPDADVRLYNKKFEEATGVLDLGASPKGILGGEKKDDKILSRESLSDAAKYQKYRKVEEYVINPVLNNIYSGRVEPEELKSLYNNQYGKKILLNVLNQELPEISKIGLDEDVFGNEKKWDKVAQKLQYRNRAKGIELQEQQEEQIASELSDVFSNYKYGKEDYISERRGQAPQLKSTKIPFRVDNINDVSQLQDALNSVERMPFIWDKDGHKVDKTPIKEKLQRRIFQLQAGKEIDKEILGLKDIILNAVDKVPLDWKSQGNDPNLVQRDAEYVMAALNYLKDTKIGEYGMIVASMVTNGKISETQFTELANLGIELKKYKDFKGGAYVSGEKRSMLTPQYKKAILSGWLSEKLEQEGYRNRSAYSAKEIISAYQSAPEDIKDDEVLSEIIKAERAPSFGFLPIPQGEGLVKKGALNSIFEGFANPVKSIFNTVSTVVDSPFDTYLKSKELDRGGQTILNKKGEFTTTLENNFWNKALEGAAGLFMQVGLARGLGLLAKTPINAAIGRVNPMAAMTTNQAALNIGTPLSTLAQTYGYEYVDFLEKTGSPTKAALGAFVSGSVQGWIEKNVMPDVKIAENINLITAKRNFAKEIINVIDSGGGQAKLGDIAKKFLDNTAKTLGKEAWGEEVLQNFTNYITELVISPKTGIDRNILKESLDTGLQATNAMILPSLLGAAGQTKINRQLSKAGINMIAAYPKEYLDAMDSQLARGEISKQDYDLATNIINLHRENNINAPKYDVEGNPISADGQLEYAYQSTVEAINKEKLNQIKDQIQKEPIEKKIKEANNIKRKIFNGKEAEIITDINELKIDQDRDLMDEPELTEEQKVIQRAIDSGELADGMYADMAKQALTDPAVAKQLINEVRSQATGEVAGELGNAEQGVRAAWGNTIVDFAMPAKQTKKESAGKEVGRGGDVDLKNKTEKELENRWEELNTLFNDKKATPELSDEFDAIEKELGRREKESVFGVSLDKARWQLEKYIEDNKDWDRRLIDTRDAKQAIDVIDRYIDSDIVSDKLLAEDFVEAIMGNPERSYADGLKLRESMKLASERGIDIKDLIAGVERKFENDGYSKEEARGVVAMKLKPIFKDSKVEVVFNNQYNEKAHGHLPDEAKQKLIGEQTSILGKENIEDIIELASDKKNVKSIKLQPLPTQEVKAEQTPVGGRGGDVVKPKEGHVYRAIDNADDAVGNDKSFSTKTNWYDGEGFLIEAKNTEGKDIEHHEGAKRGNIKAEDVTTVYYEPDGIATDPKTVERELAKMKEKFPNAKFVEVESIEDKNGENQLHIKEAKAEQTNVPQKESAGKEVGGGGGGDVKRTAKPISKRIAVEHAGHESAKRVTGANENTLEIDGYGTVLTSQFINTLVENGRLPKEALKNRHIQLTEEYATKLLNENSDLFPKENTETSKVETNIPTFENAKNEYDAVKEKYAKHLKKDGGLRANTPDNVKKEIEDAYTKMQSTVKQEREKRVLEDKRDTGLIDGIERIKDNASAFTLVKMAMNRGAIPERQFNEFGKNLLHIIADAKDSHEVTMQTAEIIQDFSKRANVKVDDTLARELQAAENLKYEPTQEVKAEPVEKPAEKQTEERKIGKYEEKAKKIADKIKAAELPDWLKADIGGAKTQGASFDQLKQALADAIIEVGRLMDKGVEYATAIKQAANNLVKLQGEENRQKIEEGFAKYYEDNVATPPPPMGEKKNEGGEGGEKKGLLNRLYEASGVPKLSKEGFEREGLNYTTSSQEEAEQLAKGVVNEFGLEEATSLAEKGTFDGDVNSLIFAEVLNTYANQELQAKTPKEKYELAKKFAEVSITWDKQARSGGRFNSAINYFYKKSPLGIKLKAEADRKTEFIKFAKGKEQSWDEVLEQIKTLPEFEDFVNQKVDEKLKEERAKLRADKKEKIHKAIDSWAAKWAKKLSIQNKDDVQKQGIGNIDAIMEGIAAAAKKAYDAGIAIEEIVENAVKSLSDAVSGDFDVEEFKKSIVSTLGLGEKKSALDSYKERLQRQIDELDKQIEAKKRNAKESGKKVELDSDAKYLVSKRDEKKKELERVAPLSKTDEYKIKQLDKVKKKLKGLSEAQKDKVIRDSYLHLIENGALDDAEFRDIIAKATGYGKLTEAQNAQLQKLVKNTNSVDAFGERVRTLKTDKSFSDYKKAQLRAAISARELADMFDKKDQILKTLVTSLQGNTISIYNAILLNPAFNVINQLAVRLPASAVQSVVDITIGAMNKKYGGEWNTVFSRATQKEFFKRLGQGVNEAAQKFVTGLSRQDYESKDVYPNQIRPLRSFKSIINQIRSNKRINDMVVSMGGKEVAREEDLSGKQIFNRALQVFPGTPAELIFRILEFGDKPMRFGAGGAQGAAFAEALGINPKSIDFKIFIEFPREEAYTRFKNKFYSQYFTENISKGLPEDEARSKATIKAEEKAGIEADYTKAAIEQEGKRSTFQQNNLFVDIINRAFRGGRVEETGAASLLKVATISPYIKIPSNAFWSFMTLQHPGLALAEAVGHKMYAAQLEKNGDFVKAKLQQREARYWLGHAAVGIGWNAVLIPLIKAGIILASGGSDEPKKERQGEATYEPQGTFNLTKFLAWVRGENLSEVKNSVTVNLKWFGSLGMMMNAMAKDYEELTPEQLENRNLLVSNLLEFWDIDDLEEMQNSVFANSSALFTALGSGGYGARRYGVSMINLFANIVQPQTIAALSRAKLDYTVKGNTGSFMRDLDNTMLQRSSWYRKLSGRMPDAKYNMWGEKMEKTDGFWFRVLGFNIVNKDNFAQPIYDDAKEYNEDAFFAPAVSNKLNGIELNNEQQGLREQLVGKARRAYVEPFINDEMKFPIIDKYYSELSKEERLSALEYFYQLGLEEGDKMLFQTPQGVGLKKPEKSIDEMVSDKLFKAALKIMKINMSKKDKDY